MHIPLSMVREDLGHGALLKHRQSRNGIFNRDSHASPAFWPPADMVPTTSNQLDLTGSVRQCDHCHVTRLSTMIPGGQIIRLEIFVKPVLNDYHSHPFICLPVGDARVSYSEKPCCRSLPPVEWCWAEVIVGLRGSW